jgi:hypothetical protein
MENASTAGKKEIRQSIIRNQVTQFA